MQLRKNLKIKNFRFGKNKPTGQPTHPRQSQKTNDKLRKHSHYLKEKELNPLTYKELQDVNEERTYNR